MTPRIRTDLDHIPSYVAGRSVAGAVKLASNESTIGPLPAIQAAIAEAAAGANRYPDITAGELVEALTESLSHTHPAIDTVNVTAGCGSVALCQQLVQAVCMLGDEVVFGWRSFEAYPIITRIGHAVPVPVPVDDDGRLNLEAMAAAVTDRTRLVFVCTPNNPTGPAVTRAELERFLDAVPDRVTVAVDEAYFEYLRGDDPVDGVGVALQRPNVVALRTFSKAYGLAGIRVGYLVGPADLVDPVAKMTVPFSVSSVAQAAAIAGLGAQDEMQHRVEHVISERERVRPRLLELGYDVPETQANFVWLTESGRGSVTDLAGFPEHCLTHRVVVRAFPGFGIRVTIGAPHENDMFLDAAAEWAAR